MPTQGKLAVGSRGGLCSPIALEQVMRFHCKIAMKMLILKYVLCCGKSKWEMMKHEQHQSNINTCCDYQGLRQISLLLREVPLPP